MAKKKSAKLLTLSPEHKEALATLAGRKEFKVFVRFLRVQQNNIAIIDWFRTKSTDPDLQRKKAYSEGKFDMIKIILKAFEDAQKGKED